MIAPRAAYRKSFFESIQRTAVPPPPLCICSWKREDEQEDCQQQLDRTAREESGVRYEPRS